MKRAFKTLFLLLIAFLSVSYGKPVELYLPFTYPGSLGKFEVDRPVNELKVVLGYREKRYVFKSVNGAKEVFFVIPYRVQKGVFSLSLYENGRERFLN